ncbi:MAG: phosphoenolpyruvate carboxykinase (ATP) [candidate division Zixibacteria bacterium]|nr:phosphoenolpyruvate carboxykinase (ATP) [candidate division Zixibacteria bacterium]
MTKRLNLETPALAQAESLKSEYGLDKLGMTNLKTIYWNLPAASLYEEIVFRNEGQITEGGAITVDTGQHTARAAQDKFIVKESSSDKHIWWGSYNRSFPDEKFTAIFKRMNDFLRERDVFVQDCYGGADTAYRLPVRVITEYAWHSLFAQNMLISPTTIEERKKFIPQFTVISLPSFQATPETDGTRTPTFILLNFDQKLCLIGGTGYGGEIKKSVFTLLNYLLPLQDVLTMHCSANVGKDKDVAVFFGLSGTGKTTLSADASRSLIGDDEHGWSDRGVFNFEGGCYAKVIRLSPSAEPQIYSTTSRFGTVLENVVFDPITRKLDLDSDARTENTRAAYPLNFISNAVPEKMAGHPKNIIMLTCDASGVMPPIAKLSPEQAMYHFISGYTSKVGGTEIGMSKQPSLTFSACFGAPFMVHHPSYYANMLKTRILKHKVSCWLVNTGWTGGPFGVGKRMSIQHTRTLLNAALTGKLDGINYYTDPVFGFQVPTRCEGVPDNVLNPAETWADQNAFREKYLWLASQFIENFKKYEEGTPPEVINAGPVVREFTTIGKS